MRSRPKVKLSFGGPLSPAVRMIIIINVVFFLCALLVRKKTFYPELDLSYLGILVELFGVSPARVIHDFALWQPISYLFVHLEFFHILFNMLGLFWFGSEIEWTWGTRKFLMYYFFTGIGAGLVSVFAGIPTIGASGAIFGLLLAYGVMFPNRTLYIYFVLPVKAKYCVLAFGLMELFSLLNAGPNTRINHMAHLSGLVFGIFWFAYLRYELNIHGFFSKLKQPKRQKPKLKVLRFDKKSEDEEDTKPTIH